MPAALASTSSAPYRVAITGAGIITSMGTGWRSNADGFKDGRLAFRPISLFDTSRQRVGRGGEVIFDQPLPATCLSPRQLSRLDRASRLLLYAGAEALTQSGWSDCEKDGSLPVVLGTSAGAMGVGESYYKARTDRPESLKNRATEAHTYQPQTQGRILSDALGINGRITIIANACASGANALGHAYHLVRSGRSPRALAGGYDALAQMVFAGFDSLQALSTTLPRPFDAHRDGLALGEGAALVTLERWDDAVGRGADIIAEIAGYGAATDVHHLTQPHPNGDAAVLSMTRACQEARLSPSDIGYINSHGTGTPLNDAAEGLAIQRWAGAHVGDIRVSSTKGAIGHLLGGAGAVEAVICLMTLREDFVPPTASVETPDPVCTFDLILQAREVKLRAVLTNSFGFGGANASLIFKTAA